MTPLSNHLASDRVLCSEDEQSEEKSEIHPASLVSDDAVVSPGVRIGPYSIVGPEVVLGRRVQVGAHVMIGGRTTIGEGTSIYPYAAIGTPPQDLKWPGHETELEIGSENVIREYASIASGSSRGGRTRLGSNNYLMAYSHIGHDCTIGNGCVLTNAVNLAGHVQIGDGAVLGGLAGVHQFCRVGELAMLAGGSMVLQDIPPFALASGQPARRVGINGTGLRRAGYREEQIQEIKGLFRALFKRGCPVEEAVRRLETDFPPSTAKSILIAFVRSSQRGVIR